ncbi:MAG: hypothetical protein Q9188_000415, partial [Gyalolechia gomerana]
MDTFKSEHGNNKNKIGNQSSSSAAENNKHPLRAHPQVMEFAAKSTIAVHTSQATEIRPIDSLPTDMLEEEFAKVRFLGSDYWIAAGRDGDAEPVDGEFVVVEQTVDKVATSTSGDGKVVGEKHS